MKKHIAIGDIHGCYKQLKELLDKLKNKSSHQLVFLGDYLDRGPESGKVLECLAALNNSVFLMGNHEQMLLDIENIMNDQNQFQNYLTNKGLDYTQVAWIKKNCLIKYETDKYFFSHAGINPHKKLESNTADDLLWSSAAESLLHVTDKLVIHGHIAVDKVMINHNNINVNTGCGKNGYLSAIVLPEMEIVTSDTIGYHVKGF